MNKNKMYGAYALRQSYPDHLKWALAGSLLLVALLIGLPLLATSVAGKAEVAPSTGIILESKVKIEKKELPKPKVATAPKPSITRPTLKTAPPDVKPDDKVGKEEKPPTAYELNHADPGATTEAGDPKSTEPANAEPGLSDFAPVEPVKPQAPDEPFRRAEQMPSFPGGDAELLKFLYKNIQYPAFARENGIEGTVVVHFIVNEKGELTHLEMLRDIGGGCGDETLRVIRKMPAWNAGRQNGRPVKVHFTLPVKFNLSK